LPAVPPLLKPKDDVIVKLVIHEHIESDVQKVREKQEKQEIT
jgi:hypothetical protein